MSEDPANADNPRIGRKLRKAQRLARLVEKHRLAGARRRLAKGSVAEARVNADRRRERFGELPGWLIVEVSANLRQVGPLPRAGVQIDSDLRLFDDLLHEEARELRRERPFARSRKNCG